MAINLIKGERLEIGLSKIEIEMGWKVNSNAKPSYDLDVSSFLLGSNGEIQFEEDFVFYGSPKTIKTQEGVRPVSHDGSVIGSVDDKGDDEDNDGSGNEIVDIDLSKTSQNVTEIIFTVSIYFDEYKSLQAKKYTFGQVRDAYILIKDKLNSTVICRYDLDEDFSINNAIEFGRLYSRDGVWKFQAIGEGFPTKSEKIAGNEGGLGYFCNKYAKKFM